MSEPVIQVQHLSMRFGRHQALTDVSFQVKAGSFVAILGPNGSGKSTLIKALLGLLPLAEGTVRLFGESPREVAPDRVGYVPQIKTHERSFPALAVELVLTALHRRWPGRVSAGEREEAVEALTQVGAEHLAFRSLSALSGGELQRVYLARSLIRKPRLLMLDEPATGIDVAGAESLYDVLDLYQRERHPTLLMVTHDLSVAYHHATHVLLLDQVQVGFGSPEETLTESNLRKVFGHVGHTHAMLQGGGAHD